MSLRQKIVPILGAVALSALNLAGCYEGKDGLHYLSESSKQKADIEVPKPERIDYFAEIPLKSLSGMAMTSGDFDKDGDLDLIDLIVGAYAPNAYYARLYFFEGDGKGNFKLKTYSK